MEEEDLLYLADKLKKNQLKKNDLKVVEQLFFSYDSVIPIDVDLIIVLAGDSLNRIKTAVDIYSKKKVFILLSGGSNARNGQKEWERYLQYALAHGVSSSDLLIEGKSTNTYENLLYSLTMVSESNLPFKRILFVSSSHHLLRVSLTLLKVLEEVPVSISYSFYPTYARNIKKTNWYCFRNGRKELALELEKVVRYQLFPYWRYLKKRK